jgi:uncharacterized membrane protein
VRWVVIAALLAACGGDDDGNDACEPFEAEQAEPGDPIDGDTFATYASGFFTTYCVRCHSTGRSGSDRNGAPPGYNWDNEASVRDHIEEIRSAVGVSFYMPLNDPKPTCGERQRLVRWIDAAAP